MTITVEKLPRPVLDLEVDTAPHPEQHWEGRLEFAGDGSDRLVLLLVAQLRLVGGLIEGDGVITAVGHDPTFPASLSGETSPESVSFAIWIHEQALSRFQVLCTGALSADERRMDGSLFSPCNDLETCNCGGTIGTFALWRVGEKATGQAEA